MKFLPKEHVYKCEYCPFFKRTYWAWIYPLAKFGGCRKGNFSIYDSTGDIPKQCPLEDS